MENSFSVWLYKQPCMGTIKRARARFFGKEKYWKNYLQERSKIRKGWDGQRIKKYLRRALCIGSKEANKKIRKEDERNDETQRNNLKR